MHTSAGSPCSYHVYSDSNLYHRSRCAHVSISGSFPPGFASWAIPPAPAHAVGTCSLADQTIESAGEVTSFLRSVLRGGRMVLSAGFMRSEDWSVFTLPVP